MGLDMYLLSAPKIDGMNLEQVLLANRRFHQLEEGDERYKLVKPYISTLKNLVTNGPVC